MQIPQHSNSGEDGRDFFLKREVSNDQQTSKCHLLPAGVDAKINSLFKKAAPEELHALYSILNSNNPTTDKSLVTRLLAEEIHKRPR